MSARLRCGHKKRESVFVRLDESGRKDLESGASESECESMSEEEEEDESDRAREPNRRRSASSRSSSDDGAKPSSTTIPSSKTSRIAPETVSSSAKVASRSSNADRSDSKMPSSIPPLAIHSGIAALSCVATRRHTSSTMRPTLSGSRSSARAVDEIAASICRATCIKPAIRMAVVALSSPLRSRIPTGKDARERNGL